MKLINQLQKVPTNESPRKCHEEPENENEHKLNLREAKVTEADMRSEIRPR